MNLQRHNRTVSVLINAYINNTLEAGTPCGCAVGNMIASATNRQVIKDGNSLGWSDGHPVAWYSFIMGNNQTQEAKNIAIQDILATGYTAPELLLIENAFEYKYEEVLSIGGDDPMFQALSKVYDVLCEINEIPKEHLQPACELFIK